MHPAQSQRVLCDESSPTFCAGRKVSEVQKALLWKSLKEDPECPSRVLLEEVARTHEAIPITVRQTNRLRVKWGLSRKKGRPRRSESDQPAPSQGEVVEVTARLSFVGVHLFAVWMEQHGGFVKVLILLKQEIEVHKREPPDEDFSLAFRRWKWYLIQQTDKPSAPGGDGVGSGSGNERGVEGGELRLYDPRSGERLPTPLEQAAARQEAETRAHRETEARREAEEKARQAEGIAQQEAEARQQADAELARLLEGRIGSPEEATDGALN